MHGIAAHPQRSATGLEVPGIAVPLCDPGFSSHPLQSQVPEVTPDQPRLQRPELAPQPLCCQLRLADRRECEAPEVFLLARLDGKVVLVSVVGAWPLRSRRGLLFLFRGPRWPPGLRGGISGGVVPGWGYWRRVVPGRGGTGSVTCGVS
jgi:hypothetical protein